MLLILFVYFIFALTFIVGKISVAFVNPVLLVALRMLIAGSMMLTYGIIKKLKFPAFKTIAFLSVLHIAIPYCFEFIAFEYTSASKVAFIFNLSPFITGLIEHFWYGHTLKSKQWLALALGFMATTMVAITGNNLNLVDCLHCGLGEFLVLISVISAAAGWLYMSKLMKKGYAVTALNGSAMLGGGLIALLASYFATNGNLTNNMHYYSWFFVFILLILGNLIAYNLYGWLLTKYRGSLLSLWGSICPLIVALLEWFLFEQAPSPIFIIASIVIAIAIKIFLSEKNIQSDFKHE